MLLQCVIYLNIIGDTKIAFWKDHIDKLDGTIDEIVGCVMSNASKGKEVKQNVSSTISAAIQELIATEMEPLGDTGFDFLEYDHLEIYQGIVSLSLGK